MDPEVVVTALVGPSSALLGVWLNNRWRQAEEERTHQRAMDRERSRWLMEGRQTAYAELLRVAHRFDSQAGTVAATVRGMKPGERTSDRYAKGYSALVEVQDDLRLAVSTAQIVGSDEVRQVARNLLLDAMLSMPVPGDDHREQRGSFSHRLNKLELVMRADFGLSTTDALLLPEPAADHRDTEGK